MTMKDFLEFYAQIVLNIAKERNLTLYLHEQIDIDEKYDDNDNFIERNETVEYYIAEYETPIEDKREHLNSLRHKDCSGMYACFKGKRFSYEYGKIIPLYTIKDFVNHCLNKEEISFRIREKKETDIYYLSIIEHSNADQLKYFVDKMLFSSLNREIMEYLIKGEIITSDYVHLILSRKDGLELIRNMLMKRKYEKESISNLEENLILKETIDKYYPNQADDLLKLDLLHNEEKLLEMLNSLFSYQNLEKTLHNKMAYILLNNYDGAKTLNKLISKIKDNTCNKFKTRARDFIINYFSEQINIFDKFDLLKKPTSTFQEYKNHHVRIDFSLDNMQCNYGIEGKDIDFYPDAITVITNSISKSSIPIKEAFRTKFNNNTMTLFFYCDEGHEIKYEQIKKMLNECFIQYIIPKVSRYSDVKSEYGEDKYKRAKKEIDEDELTSWLSKYWSYQQLEEQLPTKESTQGNKI